MTAPTSKQALLACINASNNDAGVLDSEITISLPTVITGVYNTSVNIEAKPDGQYQGDDDYKYNRVSLTVLELRDSQTDEPINLPVTPQMTTYADLLTVINPHTRVNLLAGSDVNNIDIANGATALPDLSTGPVVVTLNAHANSYGWVGAVNYTLEEAKIPLSSVLPNTNLNGLTYSQMTDYEVIAPFSISNAQLPERFVNLDGTMLVGEGNPGVGFESASNNEVYIGAGVRVYNDQGMVGSVDGVYTVHIMDDQDWNFPLVFGLVNGAPGVGLHDLYDITADITAVQTGESINLVYSVENDVPHLRDTANNIDIVDGYYSQGGRIFQEIQRLSFYAAAFGAITKNPNGAPMGFYDFTITATRKAPFNGETVAPVAINFRASVEYMAPQ